MFVYKSSRISCSRGPMRAVRDVFLYPLSTQSSLRALRLISPLPLDHLSSELNPSSFKVTHPVSEFDVCGAVRVVPLFRHTCEGLMTPESRGEN